jgi:uncharacterized lipoprotein YehR (DUF1307 family)
MKKLTMPILCCILVVSLSGCGSRYRYECQDPAMWKEAKCNPPACEATGTCTKDLVKESNNG